MYPTYLHMYACTTCACLTSHTMSPACYRRFQHMSCNRGVPISCRFFELGFRREYMLQLGQVIRESLQAALAAPCGEVLCMCVHTFCTDVHAYTHRFIIAAICGWYVFASANGDVCVCVCMCVCACVCVCVCLYIYIYIYIYTHTHILVLHMHTVFHAHGQKHRRLPVGIYLSHTHTYMYASFDLTQMHAYICSAAPRRDGRADESVGLAVWKYLIHTYT